MDFTKQDKVTIDFFEKTLADPDFYAKEVDDAPDDKSRNQLIKNVEQYARYKETQPQRLSAEAVIPLGVGGGDELAAFLANIINKGRNVVNPDRNELLKDRNYDDFLDNIRTSSDDFKEEYPLQYLGTELGSGILLGSLARGGLGSLAASTRNTGAAGNVARTLTNSKPGLNRLFKNFVLPAGVSGAGYGFAEGEDGFQNRFKQGIFSGGIAAGLGGTLGGLGTAGKGIYNLVAPGVAAPNFARKMADTVGGVQRVLTDLKERGRTLIEQGDVAAIARDNLESNIASDKVITKFLNDKKVDQIKATFDNVIDESQAGNIQKLDNESLLEYSVRLKNMKLEDAGKKYDDILLNDDGGQIVINNNAQNSVMNFAKNTNFKALPDDMKRNIEAFVDSNGKSIYKIDDSGQLIIDKTDGLLTLDDVEKLRIALKTDLIDKRQTNVIKIRDILEKELRDIIDGEYPDLKVARSDFARLSREGKIYDDVYNLFTDRKSNQLRVYLADLKKGNNAGLTANEINKIVRRAALTRIDNDAIATGNKTRYLNRLAEEDSATQDMLRQIYPGAEFKKIIDELDDLGNTTRAISDFTSKPGGRTRFDVPLVNKNVKTGFELVDNFIAKAFNPYGLTEVDKVKAARILVEQLPENLENFIAKDAEKRYAPAIRTIVAQINAQSGAGGGSELSDINLGVNKLASDLYSGSAIDSLVNNITNR